MKITNGSKIWSVLLLFFLLTVIPGCAHVISKGLREEAKRNLSFDEIFQNPEANKGEIVIWGGEIVQTMNQKDRTTLIEVLQRPLDRQGEPREAGPSGGRFLVLVDQYLDPQIYRNGRDITVGGEILGEKTRPVGEMQYRYPLVRSKEIYLWRRDRYSYPSPYSYPPPFYPYRPWGYYLPWGWGYDPWWNHDPW